ncbi:hemerythrin domain-containing protein [Nitrosomonas sp. sh817]|jgi:iron-sulfur cluster repair protein YtfE (RIC family)|uniref:hemerythrin domain-containing protein n=1 Tax=Nitrosomonas sp. sh817 TaxID=3070658 RepID=UPI0027DDD7F0|nr:hemerythrin domain-containing protein [Nitrosomonas sp. sh817]WMJ09750.1 hemerythrin domain-containing protein [Nitrosomonas sp. sh817]
MPRSGALLSLSRDHHTALVLARAARKAVESADPTACEEVLVKIEEHWRSVMASHFAQEEQLLQAMKNQLAMETISRILSDHALLRGLIVESSTREPLARLQQLGDLLASHVRFEERVLFPQLQPILDAKIDNVEPLEQREENGC